ncbi:MAG: NAD(P)/FAD-dependent oxidoreductase [Planctomycetota bacterium]
MSAPSVIEADVGIVGAGPGGMACALRLAEAGLSVVVLDEGMRPGGQIYRQLPASFAEVEHPAEPPSHRRGHELLRDLAQANVRVEARATVWDAVAPVGDGSTAVKGKLWFEQDGASRMLRCSKIVLAPGAYDRCVPFPEWTLPGVITLGAAQVMVRGFAVAPGTRAVVAGSGPLLLPTVTAMVAAGVEVVAALEAAPRAAMLRAIPGVLRSGARFREAMWYARRLWRAGIKLQFGQAVFAVEGDGRVERAVIGKLGKNGEPLRATARTVAVDVVCTGFGLVPSIEIGQRLGCKTVWNETGGGHCVEAGEFGETSVQNVFVAGEIAGIGGSEVAIADGEAVAGLLRARLRAEPVANALRTRRRSTRAAAAAMLRAFHVRPGLFELAEPDTIVCRCEDVTVNGVKAAAAVHGPTLRGIKMGCRAGMGPCQGRICTPNVQCVASGGRSTEWDLPNVQVPLKPVATSTILDAPKA